jgi:hypothetical protein
VAIGKPDLRAVIVERCPQFGLWVGMSLELTLLIIGALEDQTCTFVVAFLSPLRGLGNIPAAPTASGVGCILSPRRGWNWCRGSPL